MVRNKEAIGLDCLGGSRSSGPGGLRTGWMSPRSGTGKAEPVLSQKNNFDSLWRSLPATFVYAALSSRVDCERKGQKKKNRIVKAFRKGEASRRLENEIH